VFGRRLSHAGHAHDTRAHPLRRRVVLTLLAAALLAALALLISPPHANGNFVYWANNSPVNSIGRAKINGTGTNNAFISTAPGDPFAVAVDSKFIYWTENNFDRIGRANLDGSGVNPSFITTGVSNPTGIAVTQSNGIYWVNTSISADNIGHANIDGTDPLANLVFPAGDNTWGLAADQSFIYWLHSASSPSGAIGRATLGGGSPDESFIGNLGTNEGLAVDPSFIYWTNATTGIDRAPSGGGAVQSNFIPNASTNPAAQRGVAVNSQFIFWSDSDNARIGRANINGSAVNPNLAAASSQTGMMAAAPSNKITVNSVGKNKKKGTASINTKVPGPGQVTLNQTNTPPDVNATAAGVKQVGLTITQASSFKLAVKPTGKTAKKLSKQIKKQLKKKRKAKAKASVTVFIHFVPAGVAGVPNTQQVKVTLIKQAKKKK
jgi:virginiamycin B lyase